MALAKTYLVRLSHAVRRLLPFWHSPLNSLALYGHALVCVLCATSLAVMAVVGVLDDEIRCFDQRTQKPVHEPWLLAMCTQYSGTWFQGQRRDALSYSLFHYYVMLSVVLNLVPFAVRSFMDHRLLQKFLRTHGADERQAAVTYGSMFIGIHSGLRKRKAVVSFVSLIVMAINAGLLTATSNFTLLDLRSYPFEQYLGENVSPFGHVFPGTAECRVHPEMMLGAYTDTFGCHFPLAQHYRHIFVSMLIVIGVGLVLSLLTFIKDAVMVFAGPSRYLVHTACREPELERRIARQWTRDELEALRVVRHKTDMDAFIWILQQLDFEEDPFEVQVDGQLRHCHVTSSALSEEGYPFSEVQLHLDASLSDSDSRV